MLIRLYCHNIVSVAIKLHVHRKLSFDISLTHTYDNESSFRIIVIICQISLIRFTKHI